MFAEGMNPGRMTLGYKLRSAGPAPALLGYCPRGTSGAGSILECGLARSRSVRQHSSGDRMEPSRSACRAASVASQGGPLAPCRCGSLAPGFHFSSLPRLLVYVSGHRGCRFKSKIRSLDHFEELLMSGPPCHLLYKTAACPFLRAPRAQLGRVMGLPGRCPEARAAR